MKTSRPFRSQLVRNTASSGLANGWAMVVSLASLPALLSGLGAERYGAWVLLQTFSAASGWFSLADLGVVVATVRRVSGHAAEDDHTAVRRVASGSLRLSVALGVAAAGLLVAVGPWVLPPLFRADRELTTAIRVGVLLLAVQVVFDLAINSVEATLEGLQRVDLSRVVDVVRRTLVVGSASATALVTGDLVATLAAAAIGTVAAFLFGAVVLHRALPAFWAESAPGEWRALLREGRAVALLRPLGVIHRTMDRVIVGVLLGPSAVALVEIATQLQAAADAVLSAASYAVVPASSWLSHRRDEVGMARLLGSGTKYSMLISLPIVASVATLASPMVEAWLGPGYHEAAGLAVVAVLNIGVAAPIAVGSQLLLGSGHAAVIARCAVVALVVNLVVTVTLLETVGLVGAFIGTIVSTAVITPLIGRAFLDVANVSAGAFVRSSVLPTLVPAVAQTIVVLVIVAQDWSPWATLVIGGVVGLGVAAAGTLLVVRPSEIKGALSR